MSTVYDEGPYKNWTAIKFPSFVHKVLVQADSGFNRQIFISPKDNEGDALLGVDKTIYQSIITGDISGARIDLRNLPVISTWAPTVTGPVITACELSTTDYRQFPSGSTMGAAPWCGASIGEDYILGSLRSGGVLIRCTTGYTYNAGPPEACDANFDAPALPGFTNGETCTLSAE
tara:strand:- start:2228 stop:2752 length:525 start_codon:yes stop_codon:yes gene_type:complete